MADVPAKHVPKLSFPGRVKTVRLEVACLETQVLVMGKRLVRVHSLGLLYCLLPGAASLSSKEAENCLHLGLPQVHAIMGRSKFVLDYAKD